MNHWLIAPILLPAVLAPLMLLFLRRRLAASRALSIGSCAALVGIACALLVQADTGAASQPSAP